MYSTLLKQTPTGKSFSILQEIPVRVLSGDEIERIREPPLKVSDVDVHILLPQLLMVKNVVERLKSLSHYMTISANMRGELQLSVHTDSAEVTTHYKDLINPEINHVEGDEQPVSATRDPVELVSARVDVKDFLRFLHSHHVNPTNVVCCILEDTAVLLYVYMRSPRSPNASLGALTYYIPAVMR
jgi:HUS1 checkpoint protein